MHKPEFQLTYAHHINFNDNRARMNEPNLFNYGSINQLSFGISIGWRSKLS